MELAKTNPESCSFHYKREWGIPQKKYSHVCYNAHKLSGVVTDDQEIPKFYGALICIVKVKVERYSDAWGEWRSNTTHSRYCVDVSG